jgi:hypothetical protein
LPTCEAKENVHDPHDLLAAACLCAAACASAGPEAMQPSDDVQAQCSAQANAAAAGAGAREAAFEQCLKRAGWRRGGP